MPGARVTGAAAGVPRDDLGPDGEILVADAELAVRAIRGGAPRLIVSFTGVKHGMGQIPAGEFAGSASEGGNHVLFVSDMLRSWYSRDGLAERIVDAVQGYAAAHGIEDIRAIGNSMGGYGALFFAARLRFRAVAAFAPQVSMHPEVIAEPRWAEHRGAFGPALPRSVGEAASQVAGPVFVVQGARDTRDAAHGALLVPAPNLYHHVLAGCGHNVASHLKERGLIRDVVAAMLSADATRVHGLFAAAGLAGQHDHPATGAKGVAARTKRG